MKKAWALTKILLKTSSILAINSKNKKKKISPTRTILLTLLLIFAFGSVAFTFGLLSYEINSVLVSVNLQDASIKLILPIINLVVIVVSIFSVVSAFFLSTDNDILLPMPIKPWELMLARFFTTLISSGLFIIMFLLPVLVGYALATHAGVGFYIISIIVSAVIPVFPLSIIVLLAVLLLQKANLAKHRDLFTYLFVGIVLVISFGASSFFSNAFRFIETEPEALIESFNNIINGIVAKSSYFQPNAFFAMKSLIANSAIEAILYLLALIVFSFVVLGLVFLLTSPLYLKTIKGTGESGGKKKAKTTAVETKTRSKFSSLISVEIKTLLRSPIYFMNVLFMAILIPVVVLVPTIAGFVEGGEMQVGDIATLIRGTNFNPSYPLGFMIFLGVLTFVSSSNMVSSTAISRMGKSAGFVKAIPCTAPLIVNSKIFWGVILDEFSIVVFSIALIALKIFSPLDAIVLFITSIPMCVLFNYLSIHFDAKRPKLNWTTETQAVKENINGAICLFAQWGIAAAVAGIGFLFRHVDLPNIGYILGLAIAVITAVCDVLYIKHLHKHEYTYFDSIN